MIHDSSSVVNLAFEQCGRSNTSFKPENVRMIRILFCSALLRGIIKPGLFARNVQDVGEMQGDVYV